MPNVSRRRAYAHIKQDRFILDSCEDSSVWAGSADVSNITTSVSHKEGSVSISFDKSGTTETFATIARTLAAGKQYNLTEYLRGKLRFWLSLSSLTNIASVQLLIGESASHHNVYQIADTALATGFNEIPFDLDRPTSVTGNGPTWNSIGYIAVKVNFDATGNTLTAMLLDAISISFEVTGRMEEAPSALVPSAPTAATIAATTTLALAANANRKGLHLINTSNNRMSLGLGAAAVLNSGITLEPNGGSYEMSGRYLFRGEINAIAALASSNIAIQEWT